MNREYLLKTLRSERERRDRIRAEVGKLDAYERSQPGDQGVAQRIENLKRGLSNSENRVTELEGDLVRTQNLERMASSPRHTEAGASFGVGPQERRGHAFDEAQRQLERLAGDGELTSRAVDHIDRHLRHKDPVGVDCQYVCAVSQPEYAEAFGKILQFGETAQLRMSDEERAAVHQVQLAEQQRAMAESSGATGGFAVPITLDPTMTLVSAGAINPIRQIADIVTISTREYRSLSTDGLTATYAAEATEVGDNSPTIAQPDVITERAQSFVPVSIELFADWPTLQVQLAELFADAKDVLEATKFLSGAGHSSNEPQGILTGLAGITASQLATTGTGAVATTDIYALKSAVPYRFQPSTRFLASPAMVDRLYRLVPRASTTDPTLVNDARTEILGQPLIQYSAMSTAITTGSAIVIAGDFKKGFRLVDRIGLAIELVPHLFGSNRRPTGQRGIYAYWRNSSAVIASTDLAPLVVLSTS